MRDESTRRLRNVESLPGMTRRLSSTAAGLAVGLWAVAATADKPATSSAIPYVWEHKGKPDFVECVAPCVFTYDGAIVVAGPKWKSFYTVDLSGNAITKDAATGTEIQARADGAVRAVLARNKATGASIDCGAAGQVPSLAGIRDGGFELDVPVDPKGAPPPPAPVTPAAADSLWQKAHDAIHDTVSAEEPRPVSSTLFAGLDVSKMTADTFADPHVRVANARSSGGHPNEPSQTIEAAMVAIYSPESRKVYLLDRSLKQETEAYNRDHDKRTIKTEKTVARALNALHLTRVKLDATSLCWFPHMVGGGAHFELAPAASKH